MIQISDLSKCCGCTACSQICPVSCISMKEDTEGFLYPEADASKCIDCGLCEKVCPVLHSRETPGTGAEPEGAMVRSRDVKILKRSTSGGFFYPISKYVIKRGGVVYGAAIDEAFVIRHSRSEKTADCVRFLGSKYVQSRLGDIFKDVKKDLEEGRLVCFSGTPCQVHGLVRFLGKKYDNLILVDLVCHGVASAKLWKMYMDYMQKEHGSVIREAHFRSKKYGYNNSTMHLRFDNGDYYGTNRIDPFLKTFFSHIALRPSCYDCKFKTVKRVSDFTIFDGWNAGEAIGNHDDLGYTNMIVQSEKAKRILTELQEDLEIYPTQIRSLIPKTGGMTMNSARIHPERQEFQDLLREQGFEAAVDRYLKITQMDHAIEKAKLALRGSRVFRKIAKKKREITRNK